ncbi:hypothetical protein ACFL2T_07895 [Elusimicrobiota bacterium]
MEKFINGRPDLIVKGRQTRTAVEIQTGKSDPLANVHKNLVGGFSSIIIVATNQAAQQSIADVLVAAKLAQDSRINLVTAKAF